jgi:hypothetical protein
VSWLFRARHNITRSDGRYVQSWFLENPCFRSGTIWTLFFLQTHQQKQNIMILQDESLSQEKDFYPIILFASQSDSYSSMNLDDLLPIERQLLNSSSSFPSKLNRGVSFSGMDSVVPIESSEDWSEEERDNTWFRQYALDKCKKNAIKLCRREAKGEATKPQDSTRGMDIYFPARKELHAEYVFHVLCAYHEQFTGNPDYVAHLAANWSATNKERAHTVAIRDMYEAYFPHMMEQQHEVQITTPPPLSPSATVTVAVNPDSFNRH